MAHPLPVSGLVEGGGQDGEARAKTRWPYAWVPKEEAKRSLRAKGVLGRPPDHHPTDSTADDSVMERQVHRTDAQISWPETDRQDRK